MIALLSDEARWKALSDNCAGVAEDYDWRAVAGHVSTLYRELLEESVRR